MAKLPSTLEMLEQLISSPTISSTHSHIDQSNISVIHLLAEWLESCGFSIDIHSISSKKKKANLIAKFGDGDDGRTAGTPAS